ncbi:hypothetical protein Q5424_00855 [Conexibacter sp. JD483]|uniref:hypothetical protein n=1 Tax=unclassified Conexibacter TaxID=2627773 RepID=UPI002716E476|nr:MULTISPECIES: hypothetical protein [unclassified Conexibacter]MDO8189039.1 hypothetical protein [Conexibacter sp. CPCC 205706]MDO8198520.1 hypothetical protein [Conexibacter sp. CPCC 205762]MDR9367606.1 hypothetical protein [Conexibacter sp. JD483]
MHEALARRLADVDAVARSVSCSVLYSSPSGRSAAGATKRLKRDAKARLVRGKRTFATGTITKMTTARTLPRGSYQLRVDGGVRDGQRVVTTLRARVR